MFVCPPARFCGLGIGDSMESATLAFSSSREGASVLLDTVHGMANFCLTDYLDNLAKIHHEVAGRCDDYIQSVLKSVLFVTRTIS